jgi:hypothetical protein
MTLITGTCLGIEHQRLLTDERPEVAAVTGERVSWLAPPPDQSDLPRRGGKHRLKDGIVFARMDELSNLLEESTL